MGKKAQDHDAGADLSLTRLRARDLIGESLRSVTRRIGRSSLSLAGTVIGVAAFVTTLGLSSSAARQVSSRFDATRATQVTLHENTAAKDVEVFPIDTSQRLQRINGVVDAGVLWKAQDVPASLGVDAIRKPLPIILYAATPQALNAMEVEISTGAAYTQRAETAASDVALVGSALATRLDIAPSSLPRIIFVDHSALLIIGIISDTRRQADILSGMVVPTATARLHLWNAEQQWPQVLIRVQPGAAHVVASQAAVALRPDMPQIVQALEPPDPKQLRQSVEGDLRSFALIMAIVMLAIGALSITVSSLLAVIERIPELGLRRALGARPLHIGGQLATESAILGTIGGLLGISIGVLIVTGMCFVRHWRPIIQPSVLAGAPLIGLATGLIAGLVPAIRGARVQPVEALRS